MVCAVGIAGPSPRLTDAHVRQDVRLALEAATVIAEALGLSVPAVTVTEARIGPPENKTKWPGDVRGVRHD